MELAADLSLGFAALGALAFVLLYQFSTGGAWKKTDLGRNVMAFMTAVVVLLSLAVLRNFVPWVGEHLQLLRFLSFLVVAYIAWRRVYLLAQAQRNARKDYPAQGRTTDYEEESR